MNRIVVTGCGTSVGKTVCSAILVKLLNGDYWKPIQCGKEEDTETIRKLICEKDHNIFSPTYHFKDELSPHHAARLANIKININSMILPKTERVLIIETAGGILVPLCDDILVIDVLKKWQCKWIIVSQNYLGSINHTLLTLESLQNRNIAISGIIFNGHENLDTERAILNHSKCPFLGRILPEKIIDSQTINKYVLEWKKTGILKHLT